MRLYHISLGNMRRRKSKTLFLMLSLFLAVATFIGLYQINRAMEKDVGVQMDQYGANIVITPRTEGMSLTYGGVAVNMVAFIEHMF